MRTDYVHGYTAAETRRLADQAGTLASLLHDGLHFPPGARVLEAGCGVGAQTVQLLIRHPHIQLVAIDQSEASLTEAKARVAAAGLDTQVEWRCGDLRELEGETFDHVFVCFVLEHLADPVGVLRGLRRLAPAITVIEGDHGSAFFHPWSAAAQGVIDCLVGLQAEVGGDALVGRRLQPLLREAGFTQVRVEPRVVYADETVPGLVEGFTRKTFVAMVESVRERAVAAGMLSAAEWAHGVRELERAAEPGGTFHYTFFRAEARR
ncbi:methyltransferase domain-containing protein [Kribbella sandramycini]|uniref:Methyltransferase domain-containing protein n=1 Tax=Kribbella sandramycini TaxID=60450 RepID=A0A7Y4P4H2_9ACTN|nr:methyltransferase [Kribbella sandramycini]MBB6566125.1 SAM-dependent methyltransferase [Kribbella sandramycini]NOL45125.1 methyltransferase domain-containing protein [Kribbella sandramycini]